MRLRQTRLFLASLLLSSTSWGAEVVVSHPATAEPGEIVTITVFGDPMGAVDIAYRIELGASEGELSVVSTTTPSPFTPTMVVGTCGIVSTDGCIAADGTSVPIAATFPATTLATLALDTTGIVPGTEIFVIVRSVSFFFFEADRPNTQIITVGTAPEVPSLSAPGMTLLVTLLVASALGYAARLRGSKRLCRRS